MELDQAKQIIIREALRRVGPGACLNLARLEETIAEVVIEQGDTILAQLSKTARDQLQRTGFRLLATASNGAEN